MKSLIATMDLKTLFTMCIVGIWKPDTYNIHDITLSGNKTDSQRSQLRGRNFNLQ